MTTATKAGGAVLPVVAWVHKRREYHEYENSAKEDTEGYIVTVFTEREPSQGPIYAVYEALTPHAPAQATIDELRAEVERLTRQLQEMTDDRDSWLQQADDRAADALRFAKESEALKAKQIDVEAVMRLADEYARSMWSHKSTSKQTDAAREALRASLLGDGGTL